MKKLEKISLGKRLSTKDQKEVLGGMVMLKHPCKCMCIHYDEPSWWVTYTDMHSSCSTITYSPYCGSSSDSNSNVSCSNY